MRMLKRTLALGLSVLAAPMVLNAHYHTDFSGAYAGVDIGGGWGNSSYHTDPQCLPSMDDAVFCNSTPDPSDINGVVVHNSGTGHFSQSGLNAGAHAGYNWERGGIVFGGEADLSSLNLSDSKTAFGTFPFTFAGNRYALVDSISSSWFASLRGRVGILPAPDVLVYATVGAAFTKVNISSSYADNAIDDEVPGGFGQASDSSYRSGWTAGFGGEWRFAKCYSVKAEYLYADFGSINIPVALTNSAAFRQTMQFGVDLRTNIARLGFNYWFS